MRRFGPLFLVVCACCGGDDSHRAPTMRIPSGSGADLAAGSGSGTGASADAGSAPVATPPVATTPGTPAPLTESMASSYFATGPAADGARAFTLEKWAEARDAFTKARATATGDDIPRLELMLGLVHARLAEWPKSATHLQAALPGLPQIADYVRYQTARSLYFAKQVGKALELATAVPKESVHGADAELLVGDILRGQGDHAKVAAHYDDYLKRRPDGPRRSESRFKQAEALEKTGGAQATYVALYRRVMIDDPLSSWATKARERLTALTASLSPDLQKWETFSATEHLVRGKELFDAQRNPESEAAFDAALATAGITVAEQCDAGYHRAQSRFKARDRKGAAPMFDAAAAWCKSAKNVDLEIKSLYQAGRSWAFIKSHDIATKRYQAAQKVDPSHSYSDDALLREAEEWASLNDGKQVEAVLSSLPKKFPKGDNVAEAMWRLGWLAWREKRVDDAIKWWTQQMTLVPHDDNYFGEGQAQYWLGRAYLSKGKRADALAQWEAAVAKYPAAYYALLSLNRLRETDAPRYQRVLAKITNDPAGFDPKAPVFAFKPRPEWGTPGFQRALEFLRLGLGDSAEAELRRAGLAAPKDKKRVDDPEQIEKLWAMAFLFDRAGRYGASHWPTRWHILDYRKEWPIGGNRARWQIAYPRAYEELLARHAQTNNVPFAMQIGIVREESAFDPLLESYANAIGLTQMIPPTAKDFAKGTGIDPTRENLRDPEKNVTIGSRFLGHLFKTFKNFTALVPPGYNAGPGYVRRILRLRGTWATDELIESIADDQARNYSKRVLGTFFTYSWLYEKKIPDMPNVIPVDLIPK